MGAWLVHRLRPVSPRDMWRSKHVVVALLVAPVLALLAYFATDHWLAEQPHAAVQGADYPLVVLPGCRRPGGACELENEDLSLRLRRDTRSGETLVLESSHPVTGIRARRVNADASDADALVFARATSEFRWQSEVVPEERYVALRLVVWIAQSRYYAEVPTTFLLEE